MSRQLHEIEQKLVVLKDALIAAYKEMQEIKERSQESNRLDITSFFSYNVILPNEDRKDPIIIGSFVIKNNGTAVLTDPLICLRFQPIDAFSLTAKIGSEQIIDQDYSPVPAETWNYINEEEGKEIAEKTGEYWLEPLSTTFLEPGELLSFTNFQIKLNKEKIDRKFKLEGFVYGEELENGLAPLNKITLNV
ncbi:hypothetical protein [Halobacillus seohaensis]|uniref:Uncharacterized protein n=1 Tax=Halobacillus seohaensis TaxID=447421 RepID=A0ABW2ER26_9BACI